jgi:hypothetical protein
MARIGGASAVLGALLGLTGNLIHPQTPGPTDPAGTARVVAASQIWVPVHLALVVAFVLMLGGLLAIRESIRGSLGGALARLGLAAGIVGTGVGVVVVTLDGFAAKHLAVYALTAPAEARAAALELFRVEEAVNFALLSPLNLIFAGFTFVLYGLAAALGRGCPHWPGWIVAAAGVGGTLSGTVQAFMGEPTALSSALGIVAPTVITLWLLVMGILLMRTGPQAAEADPHQAKDNG